MKSLRGSQLATKCHCFRADGEKSVMFGFIWRLPMPYFDARSAEANRMIESPMHRTTR